MSNPRGSAGEADQLAGVGSVLLIPELLIKPQRQQSVDEAGALGELLVRLHLLPVDEATAEYATVFGARYRLKSLHAIHLATAVRAGADRFITNNSRDFPKSITEIDMTYPMDLPDPEG